MKQLFKLATILSLLGMLATSGPVFAAYNEVVEIALLKDFEPVFKPEIKVDGRVKKLEAYLAYHKSPLTPEAEHFVREADRNGLDWKLVAAISGVESTFGKKIPKGSYNGWGWGIPTGSSYGVRFKNWEEGITSVSEGLREYRQKGAESVEQIGRWYAASKAWPWKVRFFEEQIESFLPSEPQFLDFTL